MSVPSAVRPVTRTCCCRLAPRNSTDAGSMVSDRTAGGAAARGQTRARIATRARIPDEARGARRDWRRAFSPESRGGLIPPPGNCRWADSAAGKAVVIEQDGRWVLNSFQYTSAPPPTQVAERWAAPRRKRNSHKKHKKTRKRRKRRVWSKEGGTGALPLVP